VRNHDQKTRDMARSVLPSTARRGARKEKAIIRGKDRAHLRAALHEIATLDDPDDFEGDTDRPFRRRDLEEMVYERRVADKVGPLVQWALRTVEADERHPPPGRYVSSSCHSELCAPDVRFLAGPGDIAAFVRDIGRGDRPEGAVVADVFDGIIA